MFNLKREPTHPKVIKRSQKKRDKQRIKTIIDYAGTKLGISINEAIEKAIDMVAKEKSRVK